MIVGTCSECGGPVELPDVWHGICPPLPTCRNCGATKANSYGPVIPMRPSPFKKGWREDVSTTLGPSCKSHIDPGDEPLQMWFGIDESPHRMMTTAETLQ